MKGGAITLRIHERALRFRHREASIVGGVCFIVRAVVGDAPNDLFRGVSAGKSSLGVCPIGFRLAAMAYGHSSCVICESPR
jgi:hypothetical protein